MQTDPNKMQTLTRGQLSHGRNRIWLIEMKLYLLVGMDSVLFTMIGLIYSLRDWFYTLLRGWKPGRTDPTTNWLPGEGGEEMPRNRHQIWTGQVNSVPGWSCFCHHFEEQGRRLQDTTDKVRDKPGEPMDQKRLSTDNNWHSPIHVPVLKSFCSLRWNKYINWILPPTLPITSRTHQVYVL